VDRRSLPPADDQVFAAYRNPRTTVAHRRHHDLRMTSEDANSYNRISGLSVERIQTLSDGVFAVAMTLLVLDLRVPAGIRYSDGHLWQALQHLGTTFAAYLLSFTMLGTFWLAQHTLLSLCARGNRTLTWLQLGFLFVVTLLPFSASLLAEFAALRLAVVAYWSNVLLLGVFLALTCRYLPRGGLIDPGHLDRLSLFRRRIAVAQTGYAAAALLCVANTYVSVAALAVVELCFIVSPRVPPLGRRRRRRGARPRGSR
jgi:uncharacterized membrane protein